eukprot:NODE_1339_length_999_cov_150.293684_g1031_i0.p2 GENE.NODE_1339_length_999_cov_150.293684_g1031_i0~~NODE_1339_length_999_cov_150.293684_g1031_i0.p2  ORF type:complete len:154 (-),score=69.51 NODE_1339_length_999_cov_150.293684_g1031_i0:410-871(-)
MRPHTHTHTHTRTQSTNTAHTHTHTHSTNTTHTHTHTHSTNTAHTHTHVHTAQTPHTHMRAHTHTHTTQKHDYCKHIVYKAKDHNSSSTSAPAAGKKNPICSPLSPVGGANVAEFQSSQYLERSLKKLCMVGPSMSTSAKEDMLKNSHITIHS